MAAEFPIKAVITAVDKATAPLRRVTSAIEGKLNRSMAAFDRVAGSALRTTGALATKLGLLGGAGVIGGVGLLVKKQSELGDQIAKASRRAGISSATYQELGHAFELAGVSTTDFDRAIAKFTRTSGEAQAGTGALVTLLKKVNPAFLDAFVATEGTEAKLELMIEKMGALEDPSQRAALAAAAFGRSGQTMTLILENGADALRSARQEAHDLGLVLGDEVLSNSEAFVDGMTRLKNAARGAAGSIAGALMPVLQPLLDDAAEWVKLNRQLIATKLEEVVRRIGDALKAVDWGEVVDDAKRLWKVARRVSDTLGGLMGIVEKLGILLATRFAVAVGTTAVGGLGLLKGAAGGLFVLLRAHPFIALATTAAAAAVLLVENWEPIKAFFVGVWDRVKGAFGRAWTAIKGWLEPFSGYGAKLESIWTKATDLLGDVWSAVVDTWTEAFGLLGDLLADLVPEPIKAAWATLGDFFERLWGGIRDTFAAAVKWVVEQVGWLLDQMDALLDSTRKAAEFIGVLDRDGTTVIDNDPAIAAGVAAARAEGGGGSFGEMFREVRTTATQRSETSVRIEFDNMPPGARVSAPKSTGTGGADLQWRVGRRNMAVGGPA